MKITVDKEKCIGCGTCASLAPEVFELGNDGKSHVLKPDAEGPEVDQAIESCPSEAISRK